MPSPMSGMSAASKDPRRFIETEVNTPLVLGKIQVFALENNTKQNTKRKAAHKPIKSTVFLKSNQILVGQEYVESLKSSFASSSVVNPKIPPFVHNLFDDALSTINQLVSMITTLHYYHYQDDGSRKHALFRDRCHFTRKLFGDLQSIANESVRLGSYSGADDGKSVIGEIVGHQRQASVYRFYTGASKQNGNDKDVNSKSNRKYFFKVESQEERSFGAEKLLAGLKGLWKEVGGAIEAWVLFQVRSLLNTPNEETEEDMYTDLKDALLKAIHSGFKLGEFTGFQIGQEKYKDIHEMSFNKWTYSFVDDCCDQGIHLSIAEKEDLALFLRYKKRKKRN